MKSRVGLIAWMWLVALAGFGVGAHAFTLGEVRGLAIIGRPLDVAVPVQAGAGEDLAPECFAAEVYHADVQQMMPIVSLRPAAGAMSAAGVVRIQSRKVVDEPVVTVIVRASCGSNSSRRYVLLADFPVVAMPVISEPAVVSVAPSAAPVPTPPTVAETPLLPRAMASTATTRASPARKRLRTAPMLAKKPAQPSLASVSALAGVRVAAGPGRSPGKAVLKLDPLDMLSDRIDSLGSTMLFAPTEDALLQAKQIATLQSDVKALKELVLKEDKALVDVRGRLQQAESERVPVLWFYALLALLLACMAALGWLLWRQRQTRDAQETWWQPSLNHASETVAMSPPVAATVPSPLGVSAVPVQPDVDLDIDLDNLRPIAAARSPVRIPTAEVTAPHSVSVEPVLDIRQQAEFFVSLGQSERALHILKKQAASASEPNPFIYLDLLSLCYSLGLKSEFRDYRTAFCRSFNVDLPDFAAFHEEGKDLLAYPEVLTRLQAGWPRQDLTFLDACIYRPTQASAPVPFDLAAFRDLLLLHAVVEIMGPQVSELRAPPAVAAAAPESPSQLLDLDFSSFGAPASRPPDTVSAASFGPDTLPASDLSLSPSELARWSDTKSVDPT